jgi:hypothetical protein
LAISFSRLNVRLNLAQLNAIPVEMVAVGPETGPFSTALAVKQALLAVKQALAAFQ